MNDVNHIAPVTFTRAIRACFHSKCPSTSHLVHVSWFPLPLKQRFLHSIGLAERGIVQGGARTILSPMRCYLESVVVYAYLEVTCISITFLTFELFFASSKRALPLARNNAWPERSADGSLDLAHHSRWKRHCLACPKASDVLDNKRCRLRA